MFGKVYLILFIHLWQLIAAQPTPAIPQIPPFPHPSNPGCFKCIDEICPERLFVEWPLCFGCLIICSMA